MLITSSITSLFHFVRLTDREYGLAKYLPMAFSDVIFTSDQLINNRDSKYVVDPMTINEISKLMEDYLRRDRSAIIDSFMFVNGKDDSIPSDESSVRLVLNRKSAFLKLSKEGRYIEIPYKIKGVSMFRVAEGTSAQLTTDNINNYFRENYYSTYRDLLLGHLLKFGAQYIMSVVFLALASFIFKKAVIGNFFKLLKLSLYASTVLAIEAVVTSAARYSSDITSYIAVFVSIFAIFRGLNFIEKENTKSKENINEIFR